MYYYTVELELSLLETLALCSLMFDVFSSSLQFSDLSSISRCPSACSSAPPFIYAAGRFQLRRPHPCAYGLDCQGLERFSGVVVIPAGMGLIALHATELRRRLACTSMDVYGFRLGAALLGWIWLQFYSNE